jgi:hypothetical protein
MMHGATYSAIAAPDEAQRAAIQKPMAAKAKLKEAEAAKGTQRKMLMGEHMKMMNEVMGKMSAMKPRAAIISAS